MSGSRTEHSWPVIRPRTAPQGKDPFRVESRGRKTMDSNTHTPRTAKFARRALPVFAIAVLTIGLGACQTPRQGDTETTGHKVDTVQAPAGVDLNQPADRIEEQLQREAAAAEANAERFRGTARPRSGQGPGGRERHHAPGAEHREAARRTAGAERRLVDGPHHRRDRVPGQPAPSAHGVKARVRRTAARGLSPTRRQSPSACPPGAAARVRA